MARKRRFEQLQAAAATPTEKKIYVNPLQEKVDHRLEDVGKKLEGKGKTILYGVGAVVVVAILVFLFMRWSRGSEGAAGGAWKSDRNFTGPGDRNPARRGFDREDF